MIQIYPYGCGECGNYIEKARHVDDRNEPVTCPYCRQKMKRVYTVPLFTANRACDLVENRIYHGDREDVRRQQKADDAAYEKMTAGWDLSKPKTRSMDDILSSGIVQAASCSREAVEQWRADNIAPDAEPVNG